ncbi:ATP-binding protein [Micrococcaceae bacterium Sec5.7]
MGEESALDEVTAVRGVITDQHPLDLHALGLAGCIDRLTAPLRRHGTVVHWETPHHGLEIPAASAALLYQAARETLSNAFKYAEASELTVHLAAVSHGIRLAVTDDGTGFDSEAATSGRHHGIGLRLMSVAVHEAGGSMDIASSPGNGTCVTVTLPLD